VRSGFPRRTRKLEAQGCFESATRLGEIRHFRWGDLSTRHPGARRIHLAPAHWGGHPLHPLKGFQRAPPEFLGPTPKSHSFRLSLGWARDLQRGARWPYATERSLTLIVACHACPSQYSVPDAKVRGKKVRITCKHCGAAIIVDGTDIPAATDVAPPSPLPQFRPPPSFDVPLPRFAREDDVTLIARPRFGQDLSVHEEPTVIGQIPREALDFERTFSQRTQPPPSQGERAEPAPVATSPEPQEPLPRFPSARPSALPEAPESPHDETKRASPRAFARSEPMQPFGEEAPLPTLGPARASLLPTVVIKETRHEPTLVSSALPVVAPVPGLRQQRSHAVRVALMLLALALVSFFILRLR
jgi:hypothetical protein